jgi:hypothetical protein
MAKDKCKNNCNLMPLEDGYCLICHQKGFNKNSKKVSSKDTKRKKKLK